MEKEVVIQKLFRKEESPISLSIRYFSILSMLFGMELTRKEIELLAFVAVRGTITPVSAREEFITLFGSSKNSIENIKGSLSRKNLLIKVDKKYKVHPQFTSMDFSKDLILQITLNHKQK